MTETEFKSEIQSLLAAFPLFRPEERKTFLATWWQELRGFDVQALQGARKAFTEGIHEFFPTLGLVIDQCRRESERLCAGREKRNPTLRFKPEPHGCSLESCVVRTVKVSGARKILWDFSPYEAAHVLCPGKPRPTCPACGLAQAPTVNEFVRELMKVFPEETKGWNPQHKGLLLCPA